ncbi:MAG: bifunctional folylpolyglutamate synthase/dihydrofolate synthase [Alphaproteobacteria bacterium CG11_big_fil_rev_8_21_14_0_20_44_7]|nr:MAG: bifunctional folylpolyglutamate synthase/dihydrofolate synthase [Alphaproteobacteria bacterium CG11_big_fil_rev_8_21_14_0_20_44_7]
MVKMPHWPKPVGLLQNETSLQRMQEILSRLGNPQRNLPPTVHVAGTNGKGSTIAFLRAMLEAAGKIVHSYTTPHMVEFNERITLAGKQISDDYLFEIMERVRLAAEGLRLGFYESTTAGALLAFSEVKADYLLLETGMGGRLDATNIIENPIITILTTIAKDHTKFLGEDLRLIAGEKVWIVKEGSLCISSLQEDEVYPVIENWCEKKNVPFLAFGADFVVEKIEDGMIYRTQQGEWQYPKPALLGDHQYVNAASAICAAKALGVGEGAIAAGLQSAKWASRMEKISRGFVPEGWEFWLDGAHNPAAAHAIAGFIEDEWVDAKTTYLIYGTTRGRDTAEFLQRFYGLVDHIACVKVNFEPDAYDGEEIKNSIDFESSSAHASIRDAVKYLHSQNPAPARILCCGSLFMRGDI